MGQVQEETIRAVSAALADADGDLLSVINAKQEQWEAELAAAKNTARSLLGNVLNERESLRTALATASEIWGTLKPRNVLERHGKGSPARTEIATGVLADTKQIENVQSLQNVAHTIYYLEFIMGAPGAVQRTRKFIAKLVDDGVDKVVPGNAAMLVEAHAILTAVERLRDLILLETPAIDVTDSPLSWFADATQTRGTLEDFVIRDIFSNVIVVSQSNPRLLVAAGRIIESEEAEDVWWNKHLERCGLTEEGGAVRPFGAQNYRNRALESVMTSIRDIFYKKKRELGLDDLEKEMNRDRSRSQPSPRGRLVDVSGVLNWIEERRSENETVRRFVVPCLPPSFCISSSYEKELHRQFMRLITQLLHLVHPDGSMMLSESDLIALTSWYCKYRTEVGEHEETIDSFLSDDDRRRLIFALQKHCAGRISTKMKFAMAANRNASREGDIDNALRNGSDGDTAGKSNSTLPDIVLSSINEQVRRMLALKIKGMDQAIAEISADCLIAFQREVRSAMSDEALESTEEEYRLSACATANNMARCLEYSEDIRDLFVPLATERGRRNIEERMERVIEGFRSCASSALLVLIDGMDSSLRSHVARLYAPQTGTEIMLDIIATMEDYFSEYQGFLLPYHFEHLAIESLKRVIVWYLAPFLLAVQNTSESAARRFTSLPTFGEMNTMTPVIPKETGDRGSAGRAPATRGSDTTIVSGLRSLSGAAVVAQIDKDRTNLSEFMSRKVVMYQKKQLPPTLEPMQAIRSLYTCPSTTFGMSDAFREARIVISRAMRPQWVSRCGLSGQMTFRVAEVIWERREDVNPVVLLEAVSLIRSLGDKPDRLSPRESRMSSFDEGHFLRSRHRDLRGPFSERLLGNGLNFERTPSPSLLWAPSTSRSWRSRRR
ncbi:unnamed protein product [Chondrus crispus]|uniref:Exocyst complex component Sec6 n=1 Tax=Chondrus crispus TaxID=2769 RepID=R7QCM7_CHOCR|nr:unnamed protein product [Chondrus crispus]CDF36267.1 unnamed protein product [Chondrus crispus]|eukprot:XP_005716086.1 unnamed protein product [Chondrus crispus]